VIDRNRNKIIGMLGVVKDDQKNARPFFPPSALVIKAIAYQPPAIEEVEQSEEISADDWNDWVYQAFLDLAKKPQRFHACPDNPAVIECPRKRLLRIGKEAEREGKPSELFLYLMELTDGGAKLPTATGRAILNAQKYLSIANAFRRFVTENSNDTKNYKELKLKFRAQRSQNEIGLHISESTLERALREHDLNWSAYAIDADRKARRA